MGIKESIGGKYPVVKRHQSYFANGNAGIVHDYIAKHYGTKREFIGSGTKEFNFYKKGYGILTIYANSWDEALLEAKRRGFTSRNYMR